MVVLRCHSSDKRPINRYQTVSDETSDDDEGRFDGANDSEPGAKSKRRAQNFGLDGGRDDWGPPPPPLDEPKMGRIEMTSENTGTWNPVGQGSKSSSALEKTKRWGKRSDSRDHFRSDFQKHGSPAGSQRGRSDQSRTVTDQQDTAPLNLRGGGPGSYSIASSEAMRNWNRGPPEVKEWTQGGAPAHVNEGPPAAFDPWTANLPTGDLTAGAETEPQTQVGAWGAKNGTGKKSGSKKSSKASTTTRDPGLVPGAWGEPESQDQGKNNDWGGDNDQNQGGNGNDWGTSGDAGNGGGDWGGAGNANAQNHDEWNAGGDQSPEKDADWNNQGGASNWDAPENDEKKDDGAWDPPNDTSNGNNDDWGGNDNNGTKQDDEWGAAGEEDTKQDDNWGATTGNVGEGDAGQQTDTWGGDDTKQVTTGAKDPEKGSTTTGNQQAARRQKAGSALSFGNSRAKGTKPASVRLKAGLIPSNEKPPTLDWLKPSVGKKSDASAPPIAVKKTSVPGAWASPVASPKRWEPNPVAVQVPPTFSISTPPKPKPYWSKWRNPNAIFGVETEEEQSPSPEELEEPVYSIPADVAQRNMMTHQVRPGRPAAYTHKRNKPRYMDTHESPYAVFVFKYRAKGIIERMLKTTITEPQADEKARLAALSKRQLIDELVKTKAKLSVVESGSSGRATFVRKLDEKLSRLGPSKGDAPAVGEWVKTTSPTDGQGMGDAGGWGNSDARKGNGGGDSSNANGGDWGGNANGNGNGNGGESWGGNGDSNANGKSDWHGQVSDGAEKSGNGGDDWGGTGQQNGGDKNDDDGWGGNNNNNNSGGGDTKVAPDWGNDRGEGGWNNNNNGGNDTKVAPDWGNDRGGDDGWDNNGGAGDGGWGGNEDKKDESNGNGNGNEGGGDSWGGNTGGGW